MPIVVVVVIIVDRQFVVPISSNILTVALAALFVWQKELVVVGIVVDRSWACQVDFECFACWGWWVLVLLVVVVVVDVVEVP